jgi:hypothetical protein
MATDANSLPIATINTALNACDTAWQKGTGLDGQHGRDWAHGAIAPGLRLRLISARSASYQHEAPASASPTRCTCWRFVLITYETSLAAPG